MEVSAIAKFTLFSTHVDLVRDSIVHALNVVLDASRFIPHGHCYLWKPGLVGLHVISDLLIALAYFSIPVTLVYLVRRIQMPFHWMFLLFGFFITACGITHLMEVWTLWYPTYWLSGGLKLLTAIASVTTAVLLVPLVPRIDKLVSDAGLALKLSESRLRRLSEFSRIGIISWSTDGGIVEANDAFLTILGYTRDDLRSGKIRWTDITPSEYAYLDEIALQQLRETGACIPFEKEYLRKDGSRVPILLGGAFLEGSQTTGVSFVWDITERKQIEAALQQANDELELRVQQRTLELLATNAHLQAEIAERCRMETALRHSRESIRKLYEVVADSQLDFMGKIQRLLALGCQQFQLEIGVLARITDDDDLPDDTATDAFTKTAKTGNYEVVAVWLDQELAGASSPVAIARGDHFTLDHVYCAETLPASEPVAIEHVGQSSEWCSHPCYAATKLEAYITTPILIAGQLYGVLNFSSKIPRSSAFTDEEKKFLQLMAQWVSGEIARQQAELQVHQLNTELEQRVAERTAELKAANQAKDELLQQVQAAYSEAEAVNRMKDEFLATLSHELRTPLNSILGWAQLLRSRKFDEDTTRQALETIERNARSQSQLVGDILDVSRIIRGKVRLNLCSVSLATLIAVALDSVRPAAEAKAIEITTDLAPDVGTITGDPERLQQVIWNLLSNAIKFTPQGGQVEVKLRSCESANLSAESKDLAHALKLPYAQIQIKDTGEGINPEFLPYVFDRFRQADGKINKPHGGLGLGLAIVRHLVELHGGTVWASSDGLGQGATFTVNLPIPAAVETMQNQEGAIAPDFPAQDCESGPLRDVISGEGDVFTTRPTEPAHYSPLLSYPAFLAGVRILVVDDELDARQFATQLLEQSGATVTAVGSAIEAIALLTQADLSELPHILVTDIGMPEQDGYTLVRQVKAIAASRQVVIAAIALTTYASTDDRIKLLQAGFQMHVPKPVDATELVTAIASLTQRA
jgi:PAS domain S-box-containing protein